MEEKLFETWRNIPVLLPNLFIFTYMLFLWSLSLSCFSCGRNASAPGLKTRPWYRKGENWIFQNSPIPNSPLQNWLYLAQSNRRKCRW
ncbi:hypothetical protein I7I50_01277 [Histoplasma capsulatum G186AR]|uniref:Uncharacterized protein n=1 Tax=Ajellomyces capsulatus TaxID=5037 RepID=A0A8H7YVS7_AJECA|nr:hypothetical protein I7I52_08896 [Histoplasma capsulatum]QSS73200.1 hypothetical protein I7I50_01277 [Histoplasma capsulatum G186AR]